MSIATDSTIDETESPAVPMIHAALIEIMRAVGPIAKSQRNEQQSYNYRGIDAVYNAVHPLFAQHGVYSTSTVLKSEFREGKSEKGKAYLHAILTMRFTFWAADGSSVSTEVVGEGMDYSGDKASNKAMSVADKYAILQLLKIPTASIDPERHENPPAREDAPRATPRGERGDPNNQTIETRDLARLIDAWKQQHKGRDDWPDDADKQKAMFNDWVFLKTGKSSLHALKNWTRGDLNTCFVRLDGELGTP